MSDDKTITDYIHNQPPIYHLQAMGPIATLRDQFAMAALTGVMSRHDNLMPETVAEIAIRYADAMMEARK